MIKAIFFDIDGTLVSFKSHVVPESTIEAISKVREKGIKVFVATGRQFEAINNLGNLEFDGYITLNGSYCFISNEEVIYKKSISKESIRALINYTENVKPFPCIFVGEHDAYANFLNNDTAKIFDLLNFPAPKVLEREQLSEKLKNDVYQVIAFFGKEDEKNIMPLLPHCDVTRWSPLFSDIVPKNSSKQVGIDKVLEHFNIPLETTMAFGDGGNDISMLRHVRIGVAMGNAENDVKESANHVTTSVDDNGIANALKYFNII
ncbi:Cof-type HAD-IIB family hydrolase [Paludibacter sp. 221]|uniref:Cof-type HAD-IIB family hydrolase n=1 Tax=Paludibacter sp. 221 TaxID=2302939 RepID=UPI0013D33197|nr:Cof-type HAD-IIB family hydrolase [Paludibacter sp. 221]NDV46536.1 Cof-type HAD-IIB family hydrolase [Paludibacter sp. 221]